MSETPDILQHAKEALERAEKATPGPWECNEIPMPCTWNYCEVVASSDDTPIADIDNTGMGNDVELANGEFIAHARTDIPFLADAVESLSAENKRLRTALLVYADPANWKCPRCKGTDECNCFMGLWAGPVGEPKEYCADNHGYTFARAALKDKHNAKD